MGAVAEGANEVEQQTPEPPGFGERGRMRRRARFLRKARELAYRDLGGLVFDLHRFGQRNDQLVLAKLATLGQIDKEVRELEEVLRDRRPMTVLREVGIAACPRCAAIHGSDDRFCPGCGLAFDAQADRPISTAPVDPRGEPAAPTAAVAPSAATRGSAPASPPSTSPATSSARPAAPSGIPAAPSPPATGATSGPTAAPAATPSASPAPTPPQKPTSPPVAAKPALASLGPSAPAEPAQEPKEPKQEPRELKQEPKEPKREMEREPKEQDAKEREDDEEPTQILRPPVRGA
jgi:hypothetical protein